MQKPKKVTVTITLEEAETLQGFIDGAIGSADCTDFIKQMKKVFKKLAIQVQKHYPKK